MAEHFKRRGILLLISDFYDEPDAILDAIKPLRFLGNDLIVFHMLDPQEIDFDFDDASTFEDLESGEQIPVVPAVVPRRIPAADPGTHQPPEHEVLRAAHRLRAAQHERTARPCAVQLPVEPRETGAGDGDVVPVPIPAVGLGAIAVPVLVHLIQRERKRVDRIPVADVRAEDPVSVGPAAADPALGPAADARGRHRADRGGVRAARSFRASAAASLAATGGSREVVILLDQSASMGYGDRWQRARDEAGKVIDSIGGADKATLVLFSRNAEENMRATSDRGRLQAALARRRADLRWHAIRTCAQAGGEHPHALDAAAARSRADFGLPEDRVVRLRRRALPRGDDAHACVGGD